MKFETRYVVKYKLFNSDEEITVLTFDRYNKNGMFFQIGEYSKFVSKKGGGVIVVVEEDDVENHNPIYKIVVEVNDSE